MVEFVKLDDDSNDNNSNKNKKKKFKIFKIGKYSFSTIELKHLSIALVMIILTIIAFTDRALLLDFNFLFSIGGLLLFMIYFFTIGIAFILHELGHKFVAQRYGFISEFRADFPMLFGVFFLALLFPFFLFLSPGAVMILGRPNIKQNGIISVAGPLVNLSLALIFIFLEFILNPSSSSILGIILTKGIWINAFLGIFNMLPFWILDGKKVLMWNTKVYFAVMSSLIGIILFF